jgi:hypothetical protein
VSSGRIRLNDIRPAVDTSDSRATAPGTSEQAANAASPAERRLRESAEEYLDRLMHRLPQVPHPSQSHTDIPPPAPQPPARMPEPRNVAPEAWYHFRIDDGIELRVREDLYREAKGQLRSLVDALRPILRRHGLAQPSDDDTETGGRRP